MNLFVNFMSKNAESVDFFDLFAEYGNVTSVSMLDCPQSNRSKISAIVKMAESPLVGKVISARLNNMHWRGGCLKVYMPLFFQDQG